MLSEDFWRKYFEVYDILNIVIPYKKLIRESFYELGILKSDKILDIGSGTGNFSIEFKKKTNGVFGLDNSKSAIDIHKSKDSTANIQLADITKEFPFKDNFFDKAFCGLTLHVIDPEERKRVIKNIFRVLKPGGILVLANPSKDFSPFKIYINHINEDVKNRGVLEVLKDIVKMFIPTIKMFYFNFIIKFRDHQDAMLEFDEQYNLLKSSGFINIKPTRTIYANCAILNIGRKPKL